MHYEITPTVRLLIIAEIYGLTAAELRAAFKLQSVYFADLNAAGQFGSSQAIYFCNNQQSHSRNILIMHESL